MERPGERGTLTRALVTLRAGPGNLLSAPCVTIDERREPRRPVEPKLVDDAELVERCARGDNLAWEALVHQHQGRIFGVALHYLGDADEARDTAQEIFVRIYQRLHTFQGGDRFVAWMMQLARNACIDRLRRIKARPPASDLPADQGVELRDLERGPEDSALAQSHRQLLHKALAQMSDLNREIILLKEIQGLKLEEIATMLSVPLGTVKSRSSRARVELAERVLQLDPSYGT